MFVTFPIIQLAYFKGTDPFSGGDFFMYGQTLMK